MNINGITWRSKEKQWKGNERRWKSGKNGNTMKEHIAQSYEKSRKTRKIDGKKQFGNGEIMVENTKAMLKQWESKAEQWKKNKH